MTNMKISCTERVGGGYFGSCCSREAKHDPNENGKLTKCWQHSKAHAEAKRKERDAKFADWDKTQRIRVEAQEAAIPIVREVLSGCTDIQIRALSRIGQYGFSNELFEEEERRRDS